MNNKKFFVAALTSLFAFASAAVAANFSSTSVETASAFSQRNNSGDATEYDASSFHAEELARNELTVDFTSLTTTPESKSATLTFLSSSLTGWGTPSKNAYVVIDDPDYTGTPSHPSMSGAEQPTFDGYTIEMNEKQTFVLDYTPEGGQREKHPEFILPEYLTYGDIFRIHNTKILSNTFVFKDLTDEQKEKLEVKVDPETGDETGGIAYYSDSEHPNKDKYIPAFEYLIIPDDIEVIQKDAIKNVSPGVKILCECSPEYAATHWDPNWISWNELNTDHSITFNYVLKGKETTGKDTGHEVSQLTQSIGSATKNFGKLTHAITDGVTYTAVSDVNWTGDYDNPVRSEYGLEKPYHLEGTVQTLEDDGSHAIYIPESLTYGTDLVIDNNTISSKTFEVPATTVVENVPVQDIDLDGNPVFDNNGDPVYVTDINGNIVTEEVSKDVYDGPELAIYIPANVETIDNGAFSGFGIDTAHKIKIYCEAPSKPGTWSDGWTDADYTATGADQVVFWSCAFPEAKKVVASTSTSREMRLSKDASTYLLGYKHEKQDKYFCAECNKLYTADELTADEITKGKDAHGHNLQVIEDVTPVYNLPLIVRYQIKNTDNNEVREYWHEMPLLSEEPTSTSTSYYDSVKSEPLSRSFDILLDENEEFVINSVQVYNIYRQKSVKLLTTVVEKKQQLDEDGNPKYDKDNKPIYVKTESGEDKLFVNEKYLTYRIPDTKLGFKADAFKRFSREINVDEIINYRFDGITKFFDYSMITMKVDRVLDPCYWYEGLDDTYKGSWDDKMETGEFVIRYAMYNVNNSYYRLTYYSPTKGGEVTTTIPVKTPNSVVPLEKDTGNNVSFLIHNSDVTYKDGNKVVSDFSIENLKRIELVSLTINIHLWQAEKAQKISHSEVVIHFGCIDIMPRMTTAPAAYNIFNFIVVFEAILIVVYAAGAVGLFFILKEKFKNDEFRRMKPKQYVKTAILGYLGIFIISLTILFIIFRAGMFSNAVAVHNPLDVYVVIPGIISIVVIGYFIKFTVGKVKANKQRRVAKKLKLNEDAADDGTK